MTYFALQRFPRSWLDFCVDIPFLDSVRWKVWNSVFACLHLFPIFDRLTNVVWQGWRKSYRFSTHCKFDYNILLHCLSRFCILVSCWQLLLHQCWLWNGRDSCHMFRNLQYCQDTTLCRHSNCVGVAQTALFVAKPMYVPHKVTSSDFV